MRARAPRVPACRAVLPGLAGLLVLLVWLGMTGSQAAFTARVTNSTDTTTVKLSCRQMALSDSPLRLHMMGDGAATTTVADATSTPANGTWLGARQAPVTPGPCVRDSNGGDTFTRSGQSGNQVTGPTLASGTSWTTEVWIRTASSGGLVVGLGDAGTAASKGNGMNRQLFLTDQGRAVYGIRTTGPGSANFTATNPKVVTDNTWHHLVAVQDSGTIRVYVDGTSGPATTINGNVTAPTSLRIGYDTIRDFGAGVTPALDYFQGVMFGVAVYDRALTQTQVTAHHATRQ